MPRRTNSIVLAVCVAGLLLALGEQRPASAHEARKIGRYNVEVGFGDEPAYTGQKNSVVMLLHDANDRPVTDLGDTLKVDVSTGSDDTQKLTMAMEPNFEVGGDGTPGDYRAWFIPTAPAPTRSTSPATSRARR